MRLTLRTLLAYLDDILEASQAREIGARISENSVASSLVTRIRDVTRRRRIGSPELTGAGASPEPNVVAEYLDNTLDPSAVADVEKVCLDSDMHLAEVAACHQVLTIVLGEPVTIRPELRDRMYALGKQPEATNTPIQADQILAAAPSAAAAVTAAPERPVVPEYLKRRPLMRRLAPWLLVGVLLSGWLAMILTDEDLLPGWLRPVAQTSAPRETPAGAGANVAAVARDRGSPSVVDAQEPAPDAIGPGAEQAAAIAARSSLDAPIPVDVAPDSASGTEAGGAADSADLALVPETSLPPSDVVPPPSPGIPAEPAVAPTTDVDPGAPFPTVLYASSEGVMILRSPESGDWSVLPRRALLHVGDEIAAPEPFLSELAVTSAGQAKASITLLMAGGARAQLLPARPESIMELEIDRGRVGFLRPSDGLAGPLTVGVTVGGMRSAIDLKQPETRCGVYVERPQPQGLPLVETPAADEPPAEDPTLEYVPPAPTGTLFVVAGAVDVRRGPEDVIASEAAPEWTEWTNPSSTQFIALGTLPVWLDPTARVPMTTRNFSRNYEPEFALDQPIQMSIPPVLRDRRAHMARLAAQTLALTDDVENLVLALSNDHEEARLAAIVSLREWLPRQLENDDRLREAASRVFRGEDAAVAVELLWGKSDADVRSEAAAQQLLAWMGSDNVAIRELAFFQVHRLTGKDLGYRPVNPLAQREAALERWREHVKRTKGLLPPNS
ncbi:MAG: hypothetical protein KF774_12205 [Planctomyces sp.]|nr:hypothetical protein [Planctomyces sp.]